MNSTALYPLFLSVANRCCVVVGLGAVGARKLTGLLASGATDIRVLERLAYRQLAPATRELIARSGIKLEQRDFARQDAHPGALVFAATSDEEENLRIARLCRDAGALCNCATDPAAGDFIVPAIARRGSLTGALSTSGLSPALARQWREELEQWLAGREKIAWLLGCLREPILALGLDQEDNAVIFRKIAASEVGDLLAEDETDKCRAWLSAELPVALGPVINQIFAEYAHVFR